LVDVFDINITTTNPMSLGDQCYAPNLCVEEGIFSDVVFIPDNPNGYYLSWQRCCRNSIIQNIVLPGDAGLVFYAEIPDPAIGNSTPQFGAYAKTYMCANTLNTINFSATDADGDALVYSLVTPLNGNASVTVPIPTTSPGPYSKVTWKAPYSLSNIIGSTPNMSINSSTGIINVTPTVTGVFVFAVLVEEYRNGIKIGEIRRDIQYQVITCINPLTPGPTVTLTCTNPTAQISVSSSVPMASYSWTGPGIISGGNTATPTVNQPGIYTVTATTPNGCIYTESVNVISNKVVPNVTTTANVTLSCSNPSVNLSANSTTNGVSYLWTGPGTITNASTSTPTVNVPGTFTVTVTNPINGCTSSATVNVNQTTIPPNVSTPTAPDLTCRDLTSTIITGSTTPNVLYSWTGPSILSGSNGPSPVVNSAGTYVVVVTDPTTGCTNSASVLVVQNKTIPNISTNGNATIGCNGNNITISANSTTSGVGFNWSGPGIVSGNISSSPIVNSAGVYVVTITDLSNGCTNTDSVLVNYTAPPTVTVGPALVLHCNLSSDSISANSLTAGVIYNWQGPNSGIVSGSNTSNPIVNASGTYTVIVTNPANGCTATATVSVTIAPPPIANVSANVTIALGASTVLTATGGGTYLWTPSTGLSCTTCPNPIASPEVTSTYCVKVTDQYGCNDSACVTVDVYDPCPNSPLTLNLPNVFTPNGDEQNDIFFIKDLTKECVEEYTIEIYNRWGQLMFEAKDAIAHWDGRTTSGLEAPDGTYFYIIKYRKLRGKENIQKGSLALLR